MKIAAGLKAHSGWAALVVIGDSGEGISVIDRRRIELVGPRDATWAKQPYHAAEELPADKARRLVERGIEAAHRVAAREMQALAERSRRAGHEIIGCAVLVPAPMPDWTTEQILSVHMRMHKAEGVLFPDALTRAAAACGMNLTKLPEKELLARADESLDLAEAIRNIAELGRVAGPPWGKDQKNATLAAMMVMKSYSG